MLRVLIVEDSPEIVEAVSLCLQLRWPGVDISSADDGAKGIRIVESESFDVVILDINLPDIDGFKVLDRIRSFSHVPVIIVSVRRSEKDRTKGLERGADDYIVKPFSPVDLVARVNALLRRSRMPKPAGQEDLTIVHGNLVLNLASHEVRYQDEVVNLTPAEWRLLYVLIKNAGRTVSSEQILHQVWSGENVGSESLRTYIRRLRNKLKDDPPRMILTDRGKGYRFVSPG
ncbi:MAG: hypothetical protein A2Y91_02560 [Chloroflexi bacterium RBG_13_54_8]|nr:MAG: hypothetical protein A2Y91_02560 [Chloroflexi bacterium RBG_13_54_8]